MSEEKQDQNITIEINGVETPCLVTHHKRGKASGQEVCIPVIDITADDPFTAIRNAVGKENWNRAVFTEVVKQAANDASSESRSESGEITDQGYATAFAHWFLPATRRPGGVGIKELRAKQAEIFAETAPLMKRSYGQGEPLQKEEEARLLQLLTDYAEVAEKIEKASRTGKKKAA